MFKEIAPLPVVLTTLLLLATCTYCYLSCFFLKSSFSSKPMVAFWQEAVNRGLLVPFTGDQLGF